ncbi:hypothetical protein GCM10023205_04800 [Yinghuangia aomiensis]|uniref:Methyltransferase domain-containing protein n=1 Tax=Yinghuangia aomiensis TaxID=676205 RepID=A0ABP9GMI6_9ACTN
MTRNENDGQADAEAYWDGEFAEGRFLGLAPEPFVEDILTAADSEGLLPGTGLYVGVGNGRNYLPLVAGGLDLLGLDISAVGLAELARRAPERAGRLLHGSLDSLPGGATYPVVLGIQVFQHGTRDQARGLLEAALHRVAPDGLFCVRVNAIGTDIVRDHDVIGEHDDGSRTVLYRPGGHRPDKVGLAVHFYSETELASLLAGCEPVLPIRLTRRERSPEQGGTWAQWEAIVRVPAQTGDER